MSQLVVPFFDAPSFQEEITLENVVFSFTFSWNSYGSFWTLSIFDRDLNPIVLGVRLVLNYELLKMHPRVTMPKGELYVVDIKEGLTDISYEDLTSNGRCQVVYVESI
jgi:hypothetical protein